MQSELTEITDPKGNTVALSCRGVNKTWAANTARAHIAIQSVDLEVRAGEFLVLLGPSGCGKSTLLYLMAGLEPVSGGSLEFFGEPVEGASPDRSLIFQETSLFPWLNVWENVSFGLQIRGHSVEERREVARATLERVGLAGVEEKRPEELSGGMRQRVAVARSLAMRPRVLLMDEPFAALDVQTRAKMQEFLLDVWKDSGATIVFVTHHIDEAIALADRVCVFTARPGRIKEIIPIDMNRPRDPFSKQAENYRRKLTDALKIEVDRAFAEQESALGVLS
ncbi:MAG: ABC transporter ATP-binding protein [Granulosicoccus sp.]